MTPIPEPGSTPAPAPTLRRRIARGAQWTLIGFGLAQLLRLASNIVLTHLLAEETFALMAIVNATIQGLGMFSDLGLGLSIVQSRRGDERVFLDTAWTLQVIRGAVLASIAVALAWPMAAFYETRDPMAAELRWLFPLLALSVLIEGLQSTKPKTAARHVHSHVTTAIELSAQVAGVVVSVALAYWLRSVYAIALGGVFAATTSCVLGYLVLPGPGNRFRLDPECIREMFSFGKWVFLSTIVTFLALQLDRFIFTAVFPLKEAAVYGIAANLAMMTPMLMGRLQLTIALPLYSRLLDRGESIEACLRRSKVPLLAFGGLMTAGLVACGSSLIDLAYDDRYSMAGVYLPLLVIGSWFTILEGNFGAAFLATGRSRSVTLVNLTKVLSFALLLWPLIEWKGLSGAVVAVAASDAIKYAATASLACRDIGLSEVWRDLRHSAMVISIGLSAWWLGSCAAAAIAGGPGVSFVIQGLVAAVPFIPALLRSKRMLYASS